MKKIDITTIEAVAAAIQCYITAIMAIIYCSICDRKKCCNCNIATVIHVAVHNLKQWRGHEMLVPLLVNPHRCNRVEWHYRCSKQPIHSCLSQLAKRKGESSTFSHHLNAGKMINGG